MTPHKLGYILWVITCLFFFSMWLISSKTNDIGEESDLTTEQAQIIEVRRAIDSLPPTERAAVDVTMRQLDASKYLAKNQQETFTCLDAFHTLKKTQQWKLEGVKKTKRNCSDVLIMYFNMLQIAKENDVQNFLEEYDRSILPTFCNEAWPEVKKFASKELTETTDYVNRIDSMCKKFLIQPTERPVITNKPKGMFQNPPARPPPLVIQKDKPISEKLKEQAAEREKKKRMQKNDEL